MLLAGQLVDLQKEDIKTTRYKNYNKYQLGILISSFWRYRPANALAWLCMIIQSIRYVILTSGLHALAVALSCNPKGNFPFGLHNLISFLRMKLNGLASHVWWYENIIIVMAGETLLELLNLVFHYRITKCYLFLFIHIY